MHEHSIPLAVKSASAGQAGEFSAYASTFGGKPDAHGDIIAPGAFKKSLEAHRANDTAPALLWSHDMATPIGVILNAIEDSKGLRIDGKLSLDVQKGAEAYALMKMGALAMSIGYFASQTERLEKRGRLLKQISLFEVSAVAIPSNTNARVISVKEGVTRPRSTAEKIRAANAAILNALKD